MQGARIILDERHAARQHRVFAVFVVVGLLAVLGVWYWQVRSAVARGALGELQQSVLHVQETWTESRAMFDADASPPAADDPVDDAAVEDAVTKVMNDRAVKAEIGAKMTEVLQ